MNYVGRILAAMVALAPGWGHSQELPRIVISDEGTHFQEVDSGKRFVPWGVNYDHDGQGRLLDEYWLREWDAVEADFREIKALGANCVRVHLQLGIFMSQPDQPNPDALQALRELVELANETQLYLNITGLACYHKQNIPKWYDELPEQQRWEVQARFWEAVAEVCHAYSVVFCYDLMNEPILPGNQKSNDWLGGELGGKFFVQRLALERNGRTGRKIANDWVRRMTASIRKHDDRTLVTVGVIPWVFTFGKGKPIFYSSETAEYLDFVSVHFYPRGGEVDQALAALKAYDIGKPLVVEEMFPLKCSISELEDFIARSSDRVDGWFSFYWGETVEELRQKEPPSIGQAITANWLSRFQALAPGATEATVRP